MRRRLLALGEQGAAAGETRLDPLCPEVPRPPLELGQRRPAALEPPGSRGRLDTVGDGTRHAGAPGRCDQPASARPVVDRELGCALERRRSGRVGGAVLRTRCRVLERLCNGLVLFERGARSREVAAP